MLQAQAGFGLAAILALAWVVSADRSRFPWRLAAICLAVQIGVGAVFLYLPGMAVVLSGLNAGVAALTKATEAGTSFVFGYAGGGPLPFEPENPGSTFILAFQALPLVLVISALSALLFHWRVLPALVRAMAWALRRTLGIGGAEAVSAAANVFIGMVEAPILIAPYLKKMDRAGLFLVMTVGMATIAGTVFVLYARFLADSVPNAAGHLFAASVISLPAAVLIARIMVPPEPGVAPIETAVDPNAERPDQSAMAAIVRGTMDGVSLLMSIVALLLVLVALVALADILMGAVLPDVFGGPLSVQRIFGWLFAPLALAMGLPWGEAATGGALLGTKTALNELLAYLALAQTPPEALAPRSRLILTYALCGFANFGSLGIMLGGLTALVPERRGDLVDLAPRTLLSGTLATCMTGAVVGVLVW